MSTLFEDMVTGGLESCDPGALERLLRRFPGVNCWKTRRMAAILARFRVREDGSVCCPGIDENCSESLPPAGLVPPSDISLPSPPVGVGFSPDSPFCDQVQRAIVELRREGPCMVPGFVREMRRRLIERADPFFGIPRDIYSEPEPTGRLVQGFVRCPPEITRPVSGFTASILRRIRDRCPGCGPEFCFDLFGELEGQVDAAVARGRSIPSDTLADLRRCFEKMHDCQEQLRGEELEAEDRGEICPPSGDNVGPWASVPS